MQYSAHLLPLYLKIDDVLGEDAMDVEKAKHVQGISLYNDCIIL